MSKINVGDIKYRIGLDIGITSVGWCLLEHDENDDPFRILDLGVRTFPAAEVPDTGASPAVQRRTKRGMRRRVARKRIRLDKIKSLLKESLLDGKEIEFSPENLYELRAKAIDEKLSDNDLSRVLYSIAKHRGFKSNRKKELSDKENSKLLNAIKDNSEKLHSGYRTLGEMFAKDEKYKAIKTKQIGEETKTYYVYNIRNKQDEYKNTLSRNDILEEIKIILDVQKRFNAKVTEAFIKKYISYFSYQKDYDVGPDKPSPYRVSFNVGKCTYYPEEKRAPKASFTFEYFQLLQQLNNMKLSSAKDIRELTVEEKNKIMQYFFSVKEVTYKALLKCLKLENETINNMPKSEKAIFCSREASYSIMKALNLTGPSYQYSDLIDEIGRLLSLYKSDDNRLKAFKENDVTKNLSHEQIESLLDLDFSKFGNLSIKAMKQLIPYLEKGQKYRESIDSAGFKLKSEKNIKLSYNEIEELKDINNPVVRRSISQTIKVINAIINKYGSPCAIFIELSREMKKSYEERKKMERAQKDSAKRRENAVSFLKSNGISCPSGEDILKYSLYEQQCGKCMYSGVELLKKFGSYKEILINTQIDHIMPYSKCHIDSFDNKVLVTSDENQHKGNRLPYEYFGDNKEKWDAFVSRVESGSFSSKKKSYLLKEKLSIGHQDELTSAALNDTKYIAKFLRNLFERYLVFNDSKFSKKPVRTINGSMTAFMRKIWGINKIRFENDKHHAVDAAVIACVNEGMIQRVTAYLQCNRLIKRAGKDIFVDSYTGELKEFKEFEEKYGHQFQFPYPHFKRELEYRISSNPHYYDDEFLKFGYTSEEIENVRPLYVSRMVNHKLKGPIHEETVMSKKLSKFTDTQTFSKKTSLKNLKLDENNQINDYPEKYKIDDGLLYNALRDRLLEFKGNAKEAFKEPFYKPTKSGKPGNIVKSVKLQVKSYNTMELNNGVVKIDSMIRIDIFEKKGSYFFIPVYVSDYYKKVLPNRIAKAHVPEDKWPILDENYNFKFSLYQNDIIKLNKQGGIKAYPCNKDAEKKLKIIDNEYFYYNGADRSSLSINLETLDKQYCSRTSIQKDIISMEKYQIDILGNVAKVKSETRKGFN